MLSSVDKFDWAKKKVFTHLHPAFQLTQSQTWFTDQHIVFGATIRIQKSQAQKILLQLFPIIGYQNTTHTDKVTTNTETNSWLHGTRLTTLNSLKGNTPKSGKIIYTMIQQSTKPVIIRIINFFHSILKSIIPLVLKICIIYKVNWLNGAVSQG